MTVALPQILSDAALESEASKNAWCGFLAAHLDYFANLVWYLVADSMLVECVMIRPVVRLAFSSLRILRLLLVPRSHSALRTAQPRGFASFQQHALVFSYPDRGENRGQVAPLWPRSQRD
jgi:hypothetical protein